MKWNSLALLILVALMPAAMANSLGGKPPLRNPIVLVHGASMEGSQLEIGFMKLGPYFRKLPEFLGTTGTEVKVVNLPNEVGIAERAAALNQFLSTELQGRMVNLICHSLGGLDARYAVSVLKNQQIASITTIGTPHRGTPLANWAVRQVQKNYPWYWIFRLFGYDMAKKRFFFEVTTDNMRDVFNRRVVNRADVQYFSVATKGDFREGTMSQLLWMSSKWLEGEKHYMTANGHDGIVPFDSQLWGREIMTANIDHLAQINHHEFRARNQQPEVMQVYTKVYQTLLEEGL